MSVNNVFMIKHSKQVKKGWQGEDVMDQGCGWTTMEENASLSLHSASVN